jgi:hypothetical protein
MIFEDVSNINDWAPNFASLGAAEQKTSAAYDHNAINIACNKSYSAGRTVGPRYNCKTTITLLSYGIQY